MNILHLTLDELVLILDTLPVKTIGKASFVCRRFKEASDIALAGVKYVKLRSKTDKLAIALINKLRAVKTVVNNCEDSGAIIENLTFNCKKIEIMFGFPAGQALYYVRALRSQGLTVRLKKVILCRMKDDIIVKTIDMLLQEVPNLKLGMSVSNSKGSKIDLSNVLSDLAFNRMEILSVHKFPYGSVGKLHSLKEVEILMGSGIVDPIQLADSVAASNCKLEKIYLNLVTKDFLYLFNQHINSLKEVSFFNYDTEMDQVSIYKFARFLDEFGSLATPSRKRKLFASFECLMNVNDLMNIIESSCKYVDLLIHTAHSAVIQQVDARGRTFLIKSLALVKFGKLTGPDVINLLKTNVRIIMVKEKLHFIERKL